MLLLLGLLLSNVSRCLEAASQSNAADEISIDSKRAREIERRQSFRRQLKAVDPGESDSRNAGSQCCRAWRLSGQ